MIIQSNYFQKRMKLKIRQNHEIINYFKVKL